MKKLLLIAILASLVGCAGTPTLQTGPDAEYSHDGLVKVDNTRADSVWVRPGIDLGSYDSVMFESAGFRYRSVKEVNRLRISSATEFPLSSEQKAEFEAIVSEIFREQIERSDVLNIVEEEGPNTLLITGALIDIVSSVPPTDQPGRSDYFLTQLGAATLILEVADSQSGQVFARSAEGRSLEVDTMVRSNSVTNTFELERELAQWSDNIRDGLEYLVQTPMVPVVEE